MVESKNILEGEAVVLFSPVLAKAFGHCGALMIQQIHYWVSVHPNRPEKGGGFGWHFNTYDAWGEQVGYSAREVRRTVKELETQKVIATGLFNRRKYDRTRWYRVDYVGLCHALEVLLGGMWQVRTDGSGQKGQLHVARMSAPIPETPSENHIEIKTCELTLATPQSEESKPKPVGEEQSKKEGLKEAAKPTFALEAHWYSCIALISGEHHSQLTQKERGQLKMLAKTVGFDNVKAVVEFAVSHWQKFALGAQLDAGLNHRPMEPHIGFLLTHQHVARKLMQSIAEKPKPLPPPPPAAPKVSEWAVQLAKQNQEDIEQMLARFAADGETPPPVMYNPSGQVIHKLTKKELSALFESLKP